METVKIKIVNNSNNEIPQYGHYASAGMDLRAWTQEPITINPGERKLIHTGLHIDLPEGFEAQIRPRSGLALKNGITVLNSPGTIDSSYHGEIGVILVNLGQDPFTVENGDRIAQMVVASFRHVDWEPGASVDFFLSEDRGGGFGHTGKK